MADKFRLKKPFYLGLNGKLIILFSTIIILSNTFILFFSISRYSMKLQRDSISNSEQSIGNLIRNLEEYISDVERLTDLAIYSYHIQDYMNYLKYGLTTGSEAQKFQNAQLGVTLLGNIINTRSDISSIFIFGDDEIAMYKASPINIGTDFDYMSQDWYQNALNDPDQIFIEGPHAQMYAASAPSDLVFSVSRTIQSYDGTGPLGIILIDANLNLIQKYANSVKLNHDGFIFITNPDHEFVFHAGDPIDFDSFDSRYYRNLYSEILSNSDQQDYGYFGANIDQKDYQVVFQTMSKAPWKVFAVTPYENVIDEANTIRNLILVIGFLSLFIVTIISIFLSRRITRPLIRLRESMDKADHGNLDIRVPVNSADEVGQLSNSFNSMIARLDDLVHQTVRDQEDKRKLEIKALQHQINPHFLYNTLDSIIWMIAGNDKNAIKMIESLSKLFRISLSRGKDVIPLAEELEHVKNYLIIQKMRYQSKFDFQVEADENVIKYKTLKIILQPLVENSIYHGIKNKEGKGKITIKAEKQSDHLLITVQDDGYGMDKETCEAILKDTYNKVTPGGSGIGVKNVNTRIKLYFGDEYGLSFESSYEKGTTVYIKLPLLDEDYHLNDK